jgi:hypothetical protein
MREKSSDNEDDPLAELLRANLQLRKPAPPPERALSYYERHPEHRPRKQTRRSLRRRLIRGG